MNAAPSLPGPRKILDECDPVAAFEAAHRGGEPIGLPTSGTTGHARIVVRTTASWVDSFPAVTDLAGLDATSRVWIPGPLSATMNLFAAVHTSWLRAARVERLADATHAQLTPSALHRLVDAGIELTGRTLVVAGDRLDAGLRRRAESAGARILHYYGAAELSFVGWGVDVDRLDPFPGVEVEERDQVLWVRSPFLATRVVGRDGAYRRGVDGFATVGDHGRLAAGRVVVHGRDDAVVTAGATVLLADVETALRPGLGGEVAVIGLPHARLGEVVVAVLTDAADGPRARAAAAALGPGRPRRWYLVPDLPLTVAGKLDRPALVRLVRDLS